MWEGTYADPLGATLGVVVFNAVIAGHARPAGSWFLSPSCSAPALASAALVLAWARWFKPNQSRQ